MTFGGQLSNSPEVRIDACRRKRSRLLGALAGLLLLTGPAAGQDSGLGILSGEEDSVSDTVSAILRESDKNGDGKLQRDESPVGFLLRFNEFDLDRDGSIDAFEAWEHDARKQRDEAAKVRSSRRLPVARKPKREVIRTLVALIERLDTNADQRLSSDEMPVALQTKFDQFDLDGDGFLDLEEARRLDAPRKPAQSQPLGRSMARLVGFMDTDGDGLLQKKEAPLRVQRVFDQLDRNGDGAIDLDEAKAADDDAREKDPGVPPRSGR